jgi:hypothetical protein
MREEYTSYIATGNTKSKYSVKKETLVDQFVTWFRNFLDNAE